MNDQSSSQSSHEHGFSLAEASKGVSRGELVILASQLIKVMRKQNAVLTQIAATQEARESLFEAHEAMRAVAKWAMDFVEMKVSDTDEN